MKLTVLANRLLNKYSNDLSSEDWVGADGGPNLEMALNKVDNIGYRSKDYKNFIKSSLTDLEGIVKKVLNNIDDVQLKEIGLYDQFENTITIGAGIVSKTVDNHVLSVIAHRIMSEFKKQFKTGECKIDYESSNYVFFILDINLPPEVLDAESINERYVQMLPDNDNFKEEVFEEPPPNSTERFI